MPPPDVSQLDVSRLRHIAGQRGARAQTELGERYEDWRNGVQQDYGVAVSWFRRAADQGFAAGQAALGVCMSKRAVEVLRAAERLRPSPQPHELVFTSVRGMRIDASVVSKMITRLGIDAVPHGFRSSFRDWASERTDHPREVVEAALAHTVRDQTEAAYARSDLFERRRHLMDDWADYLKAPRGQVVTLGR